MCENIFVAKYQHINKTLSTLICLGRQTDTRLCYSISRDLTTIPNKTNASDSSSCCWNVKQTLQFFLFGFYKFATLCEWRTGVTGAQKSRPICIPPQNEVKAKKIDLRSYCVAGQSKRRMYSENTHNNLTGVRRRKAGSKNLNIPVLTSFYQLAAIDLCSSAAEIWLFVECRCFAPTKRFVRKIEHCQNRLRTADVRACVHTGIAMRNQNIYSTSHACTTALCRRAENNLLTSISISRNPELIF